MLNNIRKLKEKNIGSISFSLRKKFSWIIKKNLYGKFGKNSILQKPLLIYNRKYIFIGDNVTIRPGIRLEPINSYGIQTFKPHISIGDGTCIEQYCHITCTNSILIGKDVTIAAFSYISDTDHDYTDIDNGILSQSLIVKRTSIGDQSFIGMGARIMPGVRIGKHCVIGTNSVVTKDISDYSVAVGIPAKVVKKYNTTTKLWEKL
jgi:acetyltransferase-like isoleucine patch superfamily enzyme